MFFAKNTHTLDNKNIELVKETIKQNAEEIASVDKALTEIVKLINDVMQNQTISLKNSE